MPPGHVDATLPHLRAFVAEHALEIDDRAWPLLARYLERLLDVNQHMNLTRITDPADAEIRLLADSLTLLPLLPVGACRLLDIGSGGGVPGLPLAIARPDVAVTLLDATGKKVRFLAETAEALGLANVTALQGRAEELARDPAHRERYDAVTARAVARLATLAELALPFVAVGGVAILPKGSAAAEELAEARWAIHELGGEPRALAPSPVAGTTVVVVAKRRRTSDGYPRRTGVPNQSPLLGPGRR